MSNHRMMAARVQGYGGPELLVVEDTPRPEPEPGQVLLRLKATGVNPADWKFQMGYFKDYFPLQFPWIPGLEASGVVDAVGPDVTAFKPGQEVYGLISRSYAEYAVASVSDLQVKPANLSFEQAATVAQGALTAWSTVEEVDVKPGQRVLVQGGAGGVGVYSIQFLKAKGAHVIATTSGANVDFVKSLGADEVINYQTTKFEDVVNNADAVIDNVGGELIERSFGVLRHDGIFVTVAGMVNPEVGEARGIRASTGGRASVDHLAQITKLVADGKLKTQVGPVLALAQARQAQELSQTGHGRGRIVLKTG